jgi:hypothetical protein
MTALPQAECSDLSSDELERISANQRKCNMEAIKKGAAEDVLKTHARERRLERTRAQVDSEVAANEVRTGSGTNVDGTTLLTDVRSYIRRFCAFPHEHALNAVTLWAAHAHTARHHYTTPRLIVVSPELGSGKTRVLEVLATLVPESMFALNASPASIFRTLVVRKITLLVDEADTIWDVRGKDDENKDFRALLNAGYKRGATIPRCVGPKHEVQEFEVFCPTALAGIGNLPATIMSRGIIIPMRRRSPHERVEPFRARVQEPVGHALRDRLEIWAQEVGIAAGNAWPLMPERVVDRNAEVWEPILAIADAAGGEWPELARAACLAFCSVPVETISLGVRLLADLRIIFADSVALHTEVILKKLCEGPEAGLDDDAPWAEIHGKPLGVRSLASMLKKYGVTSIKVKVDGRSLQGYRSEHLWDAWSRYLPPITAQAEPPEPVDSTEPESWSGAPQVPQVPLDTRCESEL